MAIYKGNELIANKSGIATYSEHGRAHIPDYSVLLKQQQIGPLINHINTLGDSGLHQVGYWTSDKAGFVYLHADNLNYPGPRIIMFRINGIEVDMVSTQTTAILQGIYTVDLGSVVEIRNFENVSPNNLGNVTCYYIPSSN